MDSITNYMKYLQNDYGDDIIRGGLLLAVDIKLHEKTDKFIYCKLYSALKNKLHTEIYKKSYVWTALQTT